MGWMANPFDFSPDQQAAAYQTNANFMQSLLGNQTDLQKAQMEAGASMYGSDNSLRGGMYGANTQFNIADLQNAGQNWRTAQQLKNALQLAGVNNETAEKIANIQASSQNYGADRSLDATRLGAQASTQNALTGAAASMFGSGQQADASRYGSLADLYGNRYTADTQAGIAGGNNLASLAAAKMQQEAALAPTQLGAMKFNQILPMIQQILKRKGLI